MVSRKKKFSLIALMSLVPGVHKVWEGGNFIPRHIYQPAGTFDIVKQRLKTNLKILLYNLKCMLIIQGLCMIISILQNS